jgi:hypothetical protein
MGTGGGNPVPPVDQRWRPARLSFAARTPTLDQRRRCGMGRARVWVLDSGTKVGPGGPPRVRGVCCGRGGRDLPSMCSMDLGRGHDQLGLAGTGGAEREDGRDRAVPLVIAG